MAHAIEDAHAEWAAGRRDADTREDLVARGDRAGQEWIHGLRRLGAGADAVYRGIGADTEAPSRLLDDARARPSVRAAAAIALIAAGDSTAAGKLRIAAESMANPRLRVAMIDVTEASDDANLAEALEALDEIDREQQA